MPNLIVGLDLEWLWPDRVPLRRLTLIEGPPDCGKSFVALSIAAIASSGAPWPDGPQGPQEHSGVLLLCGHDDCDTVGERLALANARLDNCHGFTHLNVSSGDDPLRLFDSGQFIRSEREPVLPYDAPALEFLVEDLKPRPRLIVIDSLADYCPEPRLVNRAIARLNKVAENAGAAIAATLPAKVRRDDAGELCVRPRAADGAARCVLCIEQDAEDPERRLLVPTRMSFCPRPRGGSAFRIREGGVVWEPFPESAAIEPWCESSEAAKWLRDVMIEKELPALELFRQARECGFSPKTLHGVRRRVGVEIRRVGFGGDGGWVWSLGRGAASANGQSQKRGLHPKHDGKAGKNGHTPVNRIAAGAGKAEGRARG
jgi:hypothetical protein